MMEDFVMDHFLHEYVAIRSLTVDYFFNVFKQELFPSTHQMLEHLKYMLILVRYF